MTATSPSDVAAGKQCSGGSRRRCGSRRGGPRRRPPPKTGWRLRFAGCERTRIKVVLDGGDPQERTMRGGEVVSYEAKDKIDLEVQHGNAVRIYYGAEEPLGGRVGKGTSKSVSSFRCRRRNLYDDTQDKTRNRLLPRFHEPAFILRDVGSR